MGIPSFYRWLVSKYPKIVSEAAEDEKGGRALMEFDNLYLDMNGIIHPCFHPEDNLFPPTTFEEVFSSMYEYIDHLLNIVKPKKLLFMAVDGVAPRAKMNQQRARRFRSAKDAEMAEEMEEKLRRQFESEGRVVLPKQESQISDSNVITPGTEFMHMLSDKLQSYISLRMRENPSWANIKVILSDDKVPGEGEHKIMSFIRSQRSLPGYDPNTRHCLYGLDADLIMLALATHEIHFCILREEVLPQNKQLNSETSMENRCQMTEAHESEKLARCKDSKWRVNKKQFYQFLNVCILREYLALDLEVPCSDSKLGSDLERLVDDFIFICFFAGNDFLPHMPTLEIHEDCMDLLMHVYKNEFQNLGGYLVDTQKVDDKKGSYIKLKRVERFILAVGAFEEQIFAKRSIIREKKLRRILNDYREAKEHEMSQLDEGTSSDLVGMHTVVAGLKISDSAVDPDTVLKNTKELKQKLKENTRNQSDLFKDGCLGSDKVKLGSPGFKERYYKEKFLAETPEEMEATRKTVVAKYGEGLCWVLLYYFSGVPSWTWFYPFHYGPFASDLKGLTQTNTKFIKGLPFKPFDQLMGVLPPRSAHALPAAIKGLMCDEDSTIIDFYPSDVPTDVDGKRFLWQGICKLPFIDEERLLIETRRCEHELKEHEKIRNSQTLDRLFVRCSSEQLLCGGARTASEKIKDAITMESRIDGIKGTLHMMIPEDLNGVNVERNDDSIKDFCMFYETQRGSQNVPRLLEGVNIPEKTVNEENIVEAILWHERHGNANVRFQNQRTITPKFESRAPTVILKGAGVGFSSGRGKQPSSFSTPPGQDRSFGNSGYLAPSVANPAYQAGSEAGPFRPANSTSSAYRGNGNTGHQAYQVRSQAGPLRPVGQYRPANSTSSAYRGNGNTGHQAYQVRSQAGHLRPIGQYRPANSTSSAYRGNGNTGHQAYQVRSQAGTYRPIGQNCPDNSTSSAYRGNGNTGHLGYQARAEAGPFRPFGQNRPENSISSSYQGSGNTGYQATSVTKPTYQGRPEAGSLTTRGGYRGRGTHPVTEDRRLNNWSMPSPGDNRPRNNAWSSGPPQYPNPPLSVYQGRGGGTGRSRGWFPNNLES
ncbi:hypothetical protein ACS0TY_020595 [Phlomoides rotata]